MAFDDFPAHPTQYFLGEVPLWYTKIDYPVLRRGVQPVEVTFFQPSDAYPELRQLVGNDPVTMRVVESDRGGGRRETEIKGLIVKDVQLIAFNRIDGCRVILSDIRELIDLEGPWVHDINLIENGALVAGTFSAAAGGEDVTGRAHTLLSFWTDVLQEEAPFQGNMSSTAFDQLGADLLIPYDSYRSGGLRSEVLQQLLEYWQYDLAVSIDGEFYLASRDGSDFAAIQQLSQGDWEWADEEPNFVYPANPHLRAKKYVVPFYERHTMQVWHDLLAFRPGATAADQERPSGLELIQVYQAMDEFWDLEALLEVFGRDDLGPSDRVKIKKFFTRFLLRDTALDRTKHMADFEEETGAERGSAAWEAERNRLYALVKAIQNSERRIFQIRTDPNEPRSGGGHWVEVELGRMRPDGTMVAQRVAGEAAVIYESVTVERVTGFEGENVWLTPIGHNLRLGTTFEDGKIVRHAREWLDDPDGRRMFEVARQFDDFAWLLESANPIQAAWISKQGRIIQIRKISEHVADDAKIYMGRLASIPGSSDYDFGNNPASKEKAEAIKELAVGDELPNIPAELRDDIEWDVRYPFYVFCTAKRNAPQTMDKFWTVEVDGFGDAAQDEIVMLPDDHIEMRRNFVDHHAIRAGRPTELVPLEDGLGQPMNERQVDEQAERRVRTIKSIAAMPAPTQHTFYNPQQLRLMRLRGPLDQVVLRIRGVRVECEVSVGARGEDAVRRLEAELQRNRTRTEFRGKVATR